MILFFYVQPVCACHKCMYKHLVVVQLLNQAFTVYAFLMLLQALESVQLKQEVSHIEEERIQVLNNIEELEQKIKDLDNQMEESVREVDVTRQYINTTDTRTA